MLTFIIKMLLAVLLISVCSLVITSPVILWLLSALADLLVIALVIKIIVKLFKKED